MWVNVEGKKCNDTMNSRWVRAWRAFNHNNSRANWVKAHWYAEQQQQRILASEESALVAGVPQP